MFNEFLKYVNAVENNEIASADDFLKTYGGKSFLNGLYRLYSTADAAKWNEIVGQGFPGYAGRISVFGYDWLGRIFAVNLKTGTVLLFEPGTGEVLDIPADFTDFHNVEIVEYHEDSLASRFFEEWFEANDHYVLPHDKCAGYKVPLFLNGEDGIGNLEVSDMEVYWGIMAQLISR